MSTAGFRTLLQRLTNEAAEKYAKNSRFRLGKVFDSWEGLAENIISKAGHGRKSTRLFGTAVDDLELALKKWDTANETLAKVTKYASPETREPIMMQAQEMEQHLVQALKRVGVQRTRSAELLSRLKQVATPTSPGGQAIRGAMRQPGGSMQIRAVPGRQAAGSTAAFTGAGAAGTPGAPFGDIKMSPTRDVASDLVLASHEGAGHGLQQLGRALPKGPARTQLRKFLKGAGTTAEQVPFRPGGNLPQRALGMTGAQQARAQVGLNTLPPERMRQILAELEQVYDTPAFEQVMEAVPPQMRNRLASVFQPRKPHGDEEAFSDLMAIVLDPGARKTLPFQAKTSLSRWFPEAFPELTQARKAREIVGRQGQVRGLAPLP